MKESLKIKIAIILTLIGVSSIIIGTTFAIYENTINAGKSQVIKTGIVNFTLTESTNGLVLDNLQELTDYEGMAQETFYEFTIKNTGNTITDYEISLVDKPNSSYTGTILDDKYVKAGLLKNNNKEIIVNLKEVNRLIDKVTLDVDESVNYKLRLWLDFGDLEDEAKEALVGQKIFLALKINGIQNVNKIPTGADTLIKLTDNKDNSGLYTITHPKDSTLQIGATEDITEYRYRGASPKNYVTFNNEVWRIIGVFPTDDGTGKIENRIKIIKDQSIGNYQWTYDGYAALWSYPAKLNIYLNETYLNGLTNKAQSMIVNAKFYLGSHRGLEGEDISQNSSQVYKYERVGSANTWTGKIALMYVSDYGYASSNCENKMLYAYDDDVPSLDLRACNDTNWLYNIKANEWLLDTSTVSSVRVFLVSKSGYISDDTASYQYAVRPVLYLKSNVKITGGDGTSANPYTLGL